MPCSSSSARASAATPARSSGRSRSTGSRQRPSATCTTSPRRRSPPSPRPSAPASLLEAAGLIDRAALTVCDDVVHGYGGGYLPPVLRTPATMHGPPPDIVLRPGMMVVVQPNVIAPDGSMGVQTGELLLVTETGSESLHALARGLLRAGARDV